MSTVNDIADQPLAGGSVAETVNPLAAAAPINWIAQREEALAYCFPNDPEEAHRIQTIARQIQQLSGVEKHDVAVVLGSGLRDVFDGCGNITAQWELEQLEQVPTPKAQGHGTWMASVKIADKQVLVSSGRSHLYEGYTPAQICRLVRGCALTGIETLVLTNAGGCLRDWQMGDLVTLTDHLNFSGQSPFNGPVFVDVSQVWDTTWQQVLARYSDRTGTYALLKGPEFQTMAESRYLRDAAAADMVGMSSVLEAIAAHQMGVRVAGLSVVCDLSFSDQPCEHEQVLAAMHRAYPKVQQALMAVIAAS